MAGKSLNRVQLIGNLTRDPELRYTPTGAAVCSFSIATNRSWTTDTGEKKEEVEYHRLVAWRKLAELCSQFLVKGRKVYVEGHLATRKWTTQDGQEKSITEIVMGDMILLDSKRTGDEEAGIRHTATPAQSVQPKASSAKGSSEQNPASVDNSGETKEDAQMHPDETSEETVSPDDIPF